MANKINKKALPASPVINNADELGAFIHAQRTQTDLRIDDAAGLLNVSVSLLSGVENGKRNLSLDKLFLILDGLGLKMSITKKTT